MAAKTNSQKKQFGPGVIRTLRTLNIEGMAKIVHKNAVDHGFHPEIQNIGDWLAHMCCNKHGEVTELYDAWRAGTLFSPCDKAEKMKEMGLTPLNCAEEELADLIIRVMDEAMRLRVDIANAVAIKHLYNTTRPFKHGKLS